MMRPIPRTLEEKIVFAAQYMMPGMRLTPVPLSKANIPWEGELAKIDMYMFAAIAEAKGRKKVITVHIPDLSALTDVKEFLEWIKLMVDSLKKSLAEGPQIIKL